MTKPLFFSALLASAFASAAAQSRPVTVTFHDAKGDSIGTARLTAAPSGVSIALAVKGLSPGEHAIHVHRTPACEGPAFTSAGGHFNPERKQHGLENPQGPHAGDMRNFTVGPSGESNATVMAPGITLDTGAHSVFADGGTALVIHEAADDLKTDPTGNAGGRVACAVIKRPG